MQPEKAVEVINPIRHVGEGKYAEIWQKLFATLLDGFWARLLFIIFVLAAIFFGIRRRNPQAAALCAIFAALIAFGGGILKLVFKF